MQYPVKTIIICFFAIICSAQPLSAAIDLLSQNLVWDIATLTIASDYDPLLRKQEEPDRGAQVLMRMMKKIVGERIESKPVIYPSTLPDGDTITLSGCLYLPKDGHIKQLIIANHYTVCSNSEIPSESLALEAIFCQKGYAVLMADYIGYGISRTHIHPYLHKSSSARSVADLLLYFNTHTYDLLSGRKLENDSLLIVGYSQGAAVSLATADLLQCQYADYVKISGIFAGDGPYNPALMYDKWVEDDYTPLPCAIPLSVLGMDAGEGLHLDLTHLFKEPLLSHYPDWIFSQEHTINRIAELMGSFHVSDAMPSEGMNRCEGEAKRFYEALQRQSLTDFIPQAPLFLFHSTQDSWIPFECSRQLSEHLNAHPLLTTDFGEYGNHPIAIVRFFHTLYDMLP